MNKEIEVKWVSVDTLKPAPNNPNKHPDDQIERIAKVLKYQGFRSHIVVSNQSGYIVSGHGRLLAAKLNGWDKVPVSFQDFDDYDQEYNHMVADNTLDDWATLDMVQINQDLQSLGPFDVDLLGFRHFGVDPSDKFIENINRGDENSEWAKTFPDFKEGDGYIKLTYMFKSEQDRQVYCEENQVKVDLRRDSSWIIYK